MTWKCIFIDGKYNKNMFYPSQLIYSTEAQARL